MNNGKTTRLMVSPDVARLVKAGSSEELRAAVQGNSGLSLKDRLSLALCLFSRNDPSLQADTLTALKELSGQELIDFLADTDLHVRYLELIARARLDDNDVIRAVVDHPQVPIELLTNIAQHCQVEIFDLFLKKRQLLDRYPQLAEALARNQRVGQSLEQQVEQEPSVVETPPAPDERETDDVSMAEEGEEEAEHLSKYQTALELPVAEKIKLALTGDKEWRSILIKEPNKLVSSAVLKNPRITDGEVLAVAKNKSSNDELIRLICMNNEWLKNYEIKRALVYHIRTPLPKALRFMSILSEKDIKSLAKSREVSSVIVNNARRMLLAKEKKK